MDKKINDKNNNINDKNKTIAFLSISFLVIVILITGATITGFVSLPVEYKDLCRTDLDCRAGKQCCISYEKENIGLCSNACQNTQFICSKDSDCANENVCCKSQGALGICNRADKCIDAPILNKQLYDEMKKVEPVLESPTPMTELEYRKIYRVAFVIESVIIIVLLITLLNLIKNEKNQKKNQKKIQNKIKKKSQRKNRKPGSQKAKIGLR